MGRYITVLKCTVRIIAFVTTPANARAPTVIVNTEHTSERPNSVHLTCKSECAFNLRRSTYLAKELAKLVSFAVSRNTKQKRAPSLNERDLGVHR